MTEDQLVSTSLKALDIKEAMSSPTMHEIDHWREFEVARKKFAESVITIGVPTPRDAEPVIAPVSLWSCSRP